MAAKTTRSSRPLAVGFNGHAQACKCPECQREHAKRGPYSLGFNGHAKRCDCEACATARAEAYLANMHAQVKRYGGRKVIDVNPDKTVFVRAHFRTQRNHMASLPNTKARVQLALRMITEGK